MEFTYDGLVRHSFGFQNPNHAAALFGLLLPWLWAAVVAWRSIGVRVVMGAATAALLIMLTLTYSRTGMMVMLGELALFVWLWRREHRNRSLTPMEAGKRRFDPWLGVGGVLLAFIVAAIVSGAAGRLVGWITNPDRAFTNRFVIWRGGLELFAVNPNGVGQGNSGLLFTSCMAPEESGIVVRTMINSFLTVLAEHGAMWGLLVFCVLAFAIASGWFGRHGGLARVAVLTALAGGVVSAMLSTCFDLAVLRDGNAMGLTSTPIGMAWVLLLTFATPVVFLWILGWTGGLSRPRRALAVSMGLSLFILVSLYGIGCALADDRVPVVIRFDDATFAKLGVSGGGEDTSVVLYDDKENLATAVAWARKWKPAETVYLPLSPWHWRTELPDLPVSRLILQGQCAYLSDQANALPVTLVSPPTGLPRPPTMDELFLRRYVERPPWLLEEDDPLMVEYY